MEVIRLNEVYRTRCGNLVRVIECDVDYKNPDNTRWLASAVDTVDGHDAFALTFHRYDSKGRWLNEEGKTIKKCIHNLTQWIDGWKPNG
jgi:hypothetical protein